MAAVRRLTGEAKWSGNMFRREGVRGEVTRRIGKPAPDVRGAGERGRSIRALFLPEIANDVPRMLSGVHIVGGPALLDLPGA